MEVGTALLSVYVFHFMMVMMRSPSPSIYIYINSSLQVLLYVCASLLEIIISNKIFVGLIFMWAISAKLTVFIIK